MTDNYKNIEKNTLIVMMMMMKMMILMMMMMTKSINNQCNKEDHEYHI